MTSPGASQAEPAPPATSGEDDGGQPEVIDTRIGLSPVKAALKLQQIFTTLLAPTPPERDSLPPGTDPTADLFPPTS